MVVEAKLNRKNLYQNNYDKCQKMIHSEEDTASTSLIKLLSEELGDLYLTERNGDHEGNNIL